MIEHDAIPYVHVNRDTATSTAPCATSTTRRDTTTQNSSPAPSTPATEIACFGIAILIDDRPEPIFPRWSGYFMLWVCVLLSPTAMCVFFKHGPFAWNGLFAFYVPLTAYSIWMIVSYWLLRGAIDHEERECRSLAPIQ